MTTLIILIWISGMVLSYILGRKHLTKECDQWTTHMRIGLLGLSIFSWLTMVSLLICILISSLCYNDKPAKW